MTTANTLRSLVAVASIALATASADAATQALPAALQGKLIYAAPATLSVQSEMTDADTATYDVFIDGRTGFAFSVPRAVGPSFAISGETRPAASRS